MEPRFKLQPGSKYRGLRSERDYRTHPPPTRSIEGNKTGSAGLGGAKRRRRYLQELDGQLGQVQGWMVHVACHRPTVHEAQLVPEHLHAQLAPQRPPLCVPPGHLRESPDQTGD